MNSNPRAKRIVNEYIRPGGDRFVGMIFEAQALLAQASVQGSAALFPSDAEVIDDGADLDGRPQVTNADVLGAMAAAQALVTFANTPLAAVGNKTPLQLMLRVAVNPR